MMSAFLVVEGIHVASGIAWGGGQFLLVLGVWPALLRLPAADARRVVRAIEGPYGFAQMLVGTAAIVSGVFQVVWLGGIRSWSDATETGYGLTCVAALVLSLVLAGRGSQTGYFHQKLFDGERFHPKAPLRILLAQAIDILLLLSIITCMVMLRAGL
jgi:uncharacterized membrane protein